jgi:hypothetical protein
MGLRPKRSTKRTSPSELPLAFNYGELTYDELYDT